MRLTRVEEAWQGSRLHRAGSAWVRRFAQSRSLDRALRVLDGVMRFLERCGTRMIAVSCAFPQPVTVFLLVSVVTTLLVRGVIVGIVGQEDGRWWVPPGLMVLWGAILVGHAHRIHPEIWQGSHMRGFLRRCFQRQS